MICNSYKKCPNYQVNMNAMDEVSSAYGGEEKYIQNSSGDVSRKETTWKN